MDVGTPYGRQRGTVNVFVMDVGIYPLQKTKRYSQGLCDADVGTPYRRQRATVNIFMVDGGTLYRKTKGYSQCLSVRMM